MLCISETFSTAPAVRVEVKPTQSRPSRMVVARIGPGGVKTDAAHSEEGQGTVAAGGPSNRASLLRMASSDVALDAALDRMIDAVLGRR